ncbi:MAG: DUF447 domain-containing protein [Planctomycetota bacterium]
MPESPTDRTTDAQRGDAPPACDPQTMAAAPSLEAGRLLECVVTTANPDGTTNIAPMGPIVDERFTRFLLRPYRGSATHSNLRRTGRCVLHVTDDVELIARSALNALDEQPRLAPTPGGDGRFLVDACRWWRLVVEASDLSSERSGFLCRAAGDGRLRDFVGFNRAMHAVIEATILATRLTMLPAMDVQDQLRRLETPVRKTGGPRERRAYAFVAEHVRRFYAGQTPTA